MIRTVALLITAVYSKVVNLCVAPAWTDGAYCNAAMS
jgi:hypothetical protein